MDFLSTTSILAFYGGLITLTYFLHKKQTIPRPHFTPLESSSEENSDGEEFDMEDELLDEVDLLTNWWYANNKTLVEVNFQVSDWLCPNMRDHLLLSEQHLCRLVQDYVTRHNLGINDFNFRVTEKLRQVWGIDKEETTYSSIAEFARKVTKPLEEGYRPTLVQLVNSCNLFEHAEGLPSFTEMTLENFLDKSNCTFKELPQI